MTDSIESNKITDNIYSKYLEDLNTYYKTKRKYEIQKQSYIEKLKSESSTEIKKKLYSKFPIKCVNCKKTGGTIFKETNLMFKAVCGNTSKPCELNIEIIKLKTLNILDELIKYIKDIKNTKEDIIKIKLNFIFKYIDEEKAVELFDKFKLKLSKLQEKYNELYIYYISIINNKELLDILNKKLKEQNELINELKNYLKTYKITDEFDNLKLGFDLYVNKLIKLNNEIINLKYKHNRIEFNDKDNEYIFFQEKYNLNDMELVVKPK